MIMTPYKYSLDGRCRIELHGIRTDLSDLKQSSKEPKRRTWGEWDVSLKLCITQGYLLKTIHWAHFMDFVSSDQCRDCSK
ncbi:hypothetical protein Plhal304r1_c015g0055161 [Plasmopara halstedii]